jgi:spore coat protein CotF
MSVDPDYTPNFSAGMRAEIQQLYRPDDQAIWDESPPEKLTRNLEAGSYSQECALVVRREPHPITHQVALHSVTVQSPLIKNVLQRIFKDYKGLNTQLKQLTFKAPFHPFYYRWHLFESFCKDEQDEETKDHLDLLYQVMSEEIVPYIETMKDMSENQVISFDYLWTIFTPGMYLYTKFEDQDRFLELTGSQYEANMSGESFALECRYIDCDGTDFGYVSTSIGIEKFEGVKKIVDLEGFPCHLHPGIGNLIEHLYSRGVKLEALNGFHHMSYSGFYTARTSRQIRKRHVR